MHKKVTDFLRDAIVVLGINEYLCFMLFSDRRDGIFCSKVVQLCLISCFIDLKDTRLVLKFRMRKFPLLKEYYGVVFRKLYA
jgi:hypothetical protein